MGALELHAIVKTRVEVRQREHGRRKRSESVGDLLLPGAGAKPRCDLAVGVDLEEDPGGIASHSAHDWTDDDPRPAGLGRAGLGGRAHDAAHGRAPCVGTAARANRVTRAR